jgi:hypothetical protein
MEFLQRTPAWLLGSTFLLQSLMLEKRGSPVSSPLELIKCFTYSAPVSNKLLFYFTCQTTLRQDMASSRYCYKVKRSKTQLLILILINENGRSIGGIEEIQAVRNRCRVIAKRALMKQSSIFRKVKFTCYASQTVSLVTRYMS